MITKEQAIEIAKKHHGPGFELFAVHDIYDDNGYLRRRCKMLLAFDLQGEPLDKIWLVFCSAYPGEVIIASSRVIAISKETGEIVFDGDAHDEG